MPPIGAIKKALVVLTRCASVDDFVDTFRVFCDGSTLFVPTAVQRTIGIETPFLFQLADGTTVLSGVGVVVDAFPTSRNAFNRPGLRLQLSKVTPESVAVHARLQPAPRTAFAKPRKPRAPSPRLAPSDGAPQAIEDLVLFDKTAPISIAGVDGSVPLTDVSFPAPAEPPRTADDDQPEPLPPPPAVARSGPSGSTLVAVGALCAVSGAAIAFVAMTIARRSDAGDTQARTAPEPRVAAVHAAPPPPPPPPPPSPPPPPPPAAIATAPAPARCTLSIAATPADAEIRVDGQLLGTSPAFFVGDCTSAVVEITRKRYQTATHTVTFDGNVPQTLNVRLRRPAARAVSAENAPSS